MEREPEKLLNPGRTTLIAGLLTCPLVAAGDALTEPSQAVLAPFKRDPTWNPVTDADPAHQWSISAVLQGNDGWFQLGGDLTDILFPGLLVNVSESTGNDFYYVIKAVTLSSGNTRVGVQFVPHATADGTLTLLMPHHALTEGLVRFVSRDTAAAAVENTFAVIGWLEQLNEFHWLLLGCGASPTP